MKQYQNIGAQIVNLEKKKNVDRSTIDFRCFDEKTYLDLVTPYSDLLAIGRDSKGKHIYPPNVDFNKYLELNQLDFEISNRLHLLIGCFEKMMKTFLIRVYCEKMKAAGDRYAKDYSWMDSYLRGSAAFDLIKLNETFSDNGIQPANHEVVQRRKGVLDTIKRMGTTSPSTAIVAHYQVKYHYVPMQIAIHALTLGQLLTLFGMLNQNDKNELLCIYNGARGKRYSDAAIAKFEKDAIRIQVMRNIVNHYEPIFPFILNNELRSFSSLTNVLLKLSAYYSRSVSYPFQTFSVVKRLRSVSSYSLPFHLKIERVISALR